MERKKWYGTLIILSPASLRPFKFRFTSKAFVMFALGALVSCLIIVMLTHSIRRLATDRDRARLVQENLQLKVENKNTVIGGVRLVNRVTKIEEQARHIEELLEEQQSTETRDRTLVDTAQ